MEQGDHDLLVRIDERSNNLEKKFIDLHAEIKLIHTKLDIKASAKDLTDLEKRMNGFDSWKSKAIGAGSVVMFLISLLGSLLMDRIKNLLDN